MKKQGCLFLLSTIIVLLLSGCLGGIWTSAKLIYDRHDVYETLTDYQLSIEVRRAIYADAAFKRQCCYIDLTVFNGDILVSGHVPNEAYIKTLATRLNWVSGYRHLYNYVTVSQDDIPVTSDHWITTKIRSHMFTDSEIDPDRFKVITTDGVVYLLGDVMRNQGLWVLDISKGTEGVKKVVNLMNFYKLENKKIK